MKNVLILLAVVISGSVLGLVSFYAFSGWFNIIPWSVAAILIGYLGPNRPDWIIRGALFGYFLFLTYIVVGYQGKADTASLTHFILFAVCFSLVGALAAVAGSFIGSLLRKKILRQPTGTGRV